MSDLSLDRFTAWQGERFLVRLTAGDQLATELIEARHLPGTAFAGRQPFSLLFKGPSSPVLPQSIYEMVREGDSHPLDVFLVPVSVDASGACYEAVFN